MSEEPEYVVCDKCGTTEIHVVSTMRWQCPECGSESAWLFANYRAASEHSQLIQGKAGLAS